MKLKKFFGGLLLTVGILGILLGGSCAIILASLAYEYDNHVFTNMFRAPISDILLSLLIFAGTVVVPLAILISFTVAGLHLMKAK